MITLYLDFDRTIFNTDDCYTYCVHSSFRNEFKYDDLMEYIPSLVYPDARKFLERHVKDLNIKILTFGPKDVQRIKVESAHVLQYCSEAIYVEGSKADILVDRIQEHEGPVVFVDDTISHLVEINGVLPQIHCLRMRRPGVKGSDVVQETFPEVSTFNDIEEIIRKLK